MTATLIVLGSANTDFTVLVERHPQPGETLMGGDLVTATGGKGANQALAAARSGALPVFLGAVGPDANGRAMLDTLGAGGVDVSSTLTLEDAPTGVALITVSRDGENTIVVAPGANGHLSVDAILPTVRELAGPRTVLLAQLEIPLEVVVAAADAVERAGGRVVLNLSPSREIPEALLALCDPLVVNESEAHDLAGLAVDSVDEASAAASALLERCRSVVITLGGDGAVHASPSGSGHVPAPRVTVVDTTGAGDAFVGAVCAELAEGADLDAAVERGVAAGAAAVQWLGAQPPRD
ncbi:MAG: ribokinase [Microcella sp.]|uniref:ribokinase n=1 Tax=Microcella sp. TaxID=1913979 RepID=UPI003315404B